MEKQHRDREGGKERQRDRDSGSRQAGGRWAARGRNGIEEANRQGGQREIEPGSTTIGMASSGEQGVPGGQACGGRSWAGSRQLGGQVGVRTRMASLVRGVGVREARCTGRWGVSRAGVGWGLGGDPEAGVQESWGDAEKSVAKATR